MLALRLCLLASAASALRVTVLGGTGFVGSRVCKALATTDPSVEVVSVSRTGEVPEWCKGDDWTNQVSWVKNELTRGSREKLQEAIGAPDAVVSCVGAIGFGQQALLLGNGIANVEAATAAKVVGAQRMAYVSVGSEVDASKGWCVAIRTTHLCAGPAAKVRDRVQPTADPAFLRLPRLPGFFGAYFEGKRTAEEAMAAEFGENACIIKPSFIYGGDNFGLLPPRVSGWYGSFIEELLSQAAFVKGADILPGLIGVALRPPVNVDAVAAACVAHALGECSETELDGTAAINAVAGLPPARGLTDAIEGIKSKLSDES